MRLLPIFFIFFSLNLWGVTKAPLLLRACINNNDSIVTLTWNSVEDACGSFEKYSIYGDAGDGLYTKIVDIQNITVQQHSFKVPDLNNTRSYFIRVLYLCDMSDSLSSSILKIDANKPSTTDLDSVSYDMVTQDIIAGWRSNPTPDAWGYRLYRHSSGINDSIGETTDTFYTISEAPANLFDVTIAAFDSCYLFSSISDPHRVVRLEASIDTCDRRIDLNWNLYKGWTNIDSQVLFVNKNRQGFRRFMNLGTGSTYSFTDFILGDTVCFIIRSYTQTYTRISSSSNIQCIESRAFSIPEHLYLSQVSVEPDESVFIRWITDNSRDIAVFNVYRAAGNGEFQLFSANPANPSETNYNTKDASASVNEQIYHYQIRAENQCAEPVINSQEANTVLLQIEDYELKHNAYKNWDGETILYTLYRQEPAGSTWNLFDQSSDVFLMEDFDSAGCYYIEAQEGLNQYHEAETSTSNIICVEKDLSAYVPNAIRRGGNNNRFVVIGEGIDHEKSYYQIFNRWGEKLVESSTNTPWYTDYKGASVPTGIYVYIVYIEGFKGEKQSFKGVLRIIE